MSGRLKGAGSWLFLLLLLAAVSVGSIALGTQLQDEADPQAPEERVRGDGSLTIDPEPMTLADAKGAPARSASAAVLQVWYWAQWGSAPNVVGAYLPEVVRNVGPDEIAGAYSLRRGALVAAKPRLIGEVPGPRGTVVTVQELRRNEEPRPYSFTLKKVNGTWFIVFDTLLEESIAAYAQ